MNSMRVCHIITRLILGGAQENTLYNCEDLVADHGDEVHLVTGPAEGPEGDLFARAQRNGVPVVLVPELRRALAPRTDHAAYRRLRAEIRRLRPDVVHTHSSKAGILGRAAAHAERVPAVVHTIHGMPFHRYERWWKNRLYVAAERWAARRCHRIVSVADAMTEQAVAAGVAPPEKFVTIHSGMEVETFLTPPRPPAEVRAELGLAADDLVVGKFARLFELKGHDDVIDAAGPLCERFQRLRFLFVGGGVWRARLEAKAAELGLADRFVFAGLVPPTRIPELIHATDAVVHASYREGLARVLPQALLCGKPVVSFDVDGAREVVADDQTGYLVPAGNVPVLGEKLGRLLGDAELRRRLGETGRERCRGIFPHRRMTDRIRSEYQAALDGKR